MSQSGSETQMWPERFKYEGCPQRDVRVMGWRALTERDCKSAVLNRWAAEVPQNGIFLDLWPRVYGTTTSHKEQALLGLRLHLYRKVNC